MLVTVNNRLKFEIEIIYDLSCHPIYRCCPLPNLCVTVIKRTAFNALKFCDVKGLRSGKAFGKEFLNRKWHLSSLNKSLKKTNQSCCVGNFVFLVMYFK